MWPMDQNPAKSEIEQMLKLAYYVDPSILRPEDVVNFGVDFHRLKEFGEVRMKKDVKRLRSHLPKLWERMTDDQKAAFLINGVLERLEEISTILGHLEEMTGELQETHEGMDMALHGIWAKLPLGLRERLKRGLGKEWSKPKAGGQDSEVL